MAALAGYIRLPDPVRERTLAAAHQQAKRAAAQYAQLLAAEAGIAARAVHPHVARLVFRPSFGTYCISSHPVSALASSLSTSR